MFRSIEISHHGKEDIVVGNPLSTRMFVLRKDFVTSIKLDKVAT